MFGRGLWGPLKRKWTTGERKSTTWCENQSTDETIVIDYQVK